MNLKLFSYLRKYWFLALLTPLLMVGETVIDLLQPTLMADIIDLGVIPGDMEQVISIGLRMLVFVVFGGFFGMAASFTSSAVSQKFGYDLREDAFAKVMSLSLEQTDKFTTGSLVTRLTNDITQVQNFVAMLLRMMVRAPINFIGGIVMALSLDVKFSLVILAALPIQLIYVFIIISKCTPLFDVVQKKLDRVNSVVQENVNGARVVKAYVREDYENSRFENANREMHDVSLKVAYTMAKLFPVINIIMYAAVCAIILIGGYQVEAGAYDVGKVMAAVSYITQILMSLMMVSMMFQQISRSNASANRIRDILECRPVIMSAENPVPDKKDANVKGGSVIFENAAFHYPGTVGAPVLKDIDLDIKPGEYVAVLGATGSGKSSLINLIPRFYDVTEGSVKVDGVDVRDYELDTLRHKIAVVLQKSELFSGTVMDNIRWGRPDATDEEVISAAKIAQADEFITSFNDGYQTIIGEKGASLSGGQKQRVAIARALLRNPEILIFDDSTSALDLGTEARLRTALRENMKGTTIIMIAQRIASVMQADRIAVLEDGVITACASHSELMKTSAAYRDIYDSQIREGGDN